MTPIKAHLIWSAPAERSVDGALDGDRLAAFFKSKAVPRSAFHRAPNKNRSGEKDGTVIGWLFLPSTVLTVSGSRGLLIGDCQLPIAHSTLAKRQSAIGNPRTLSLSLCDFSSPENL
jgi:hypothetical protein